MYYRIIYNQVYEECNFNNFQGLNMNRGTHVTVGGLVGAGIYIIEAKKDGNESSLAGTVIAGVIGGYAGRLPDKLEPAGSSDHRGFFHSITFAGIATCVICRILKKDNLNKYFRIGLKCFAAGYGSHLAMDSTTPAGLPFLS